MRPETTTSYLPSGRGFARLVCWAKLGYEYLVLYAGLFLFATICLCWSLIATPLYLLLPRKFGARVGQFAIMVCFRVFIFIMRGSGIFRCDLNQLDLLRNQGALIIAPNHPSLIDVVLIASRLPNIVCIMKAEIWDNILLGGGARLAGYIRNDSPRNMVKLAAAATIPGNQLLIFPEGTRSVQAPVNQFKGGFALIAKTAGVPVQTVFIETNSRFLGKGWALFRKPTFPLEYRVRLGDRFHVEGDVKRFITDLQNYYRQALESGPLPTGRRDHDGD